MMDSNRGGSEPKAQGPRVDKAARGRPPAWKLEDAKARFSELVRRARSEGPQRVTCRGKDAVVVIAAEDFALFEPNERTGADLAAFLQQTALGELELIREEDHGRDLPF
ncbi:MAG: type II toxin-antitoxin system Phd/YefM family antitoxin [Geminicoccales bacterium]